MNYLYLFQVLPRNHCEGIKQYIVGLIIKTSSSADSMEKDQGENLPQQNQPHPGFHPQAQWPKNWVYLYQILLVRQKKIKIKNMFFQFVCTGASKTHEEL